MEGVEHYLNCLLAGWWSPATTSPRLWQERCGGFLPGMVVVDMVEVDGPSSASDSELGIEEVTDKRDGSETYQCMGRSPFLLVSARVVAPSSLTDVNENDAPLLP